MASLKSKISWKFTKLNRPPFKKMLIVGKLVQSLPKTSTFYLIEDLLLNYCQLKTVTFLCLWVELNKDKKIGNRKSNQEWTRNMNKWRLIEKMVVKSYFFRRRLIKRHKNRQTITKASEYLKLDRRKKAS